MRIVQNDAFNAFVLDGKNVFVHTGTLMQANTPNEVIGVIAHETGHITGGHMAALRARIAKDQTRALLAQILGIGLMVAGGVAGGDSARDLGSAGQGVLFGGNEVIMRSLLAERRQQELAADQAGLSFLNATQAVGARHAGDVRALRRAGIHLGCAEGRVRAQPSSLDRPLGAPAQARRDEPLLQGQGSARAAAAPRPDARQAVGLSREAAGRLQSLPAQRPDAAGPLRARPRRASSRAALARSKAALAEFDGLIASRPRLPLFLGGARATC